MSHWAEINENNVVVQVAVGNDSYPDEGEAFFNQIIGGTWIKTSINTVGGIHINPQTGLPSEDQSKALRKNYASIGGTYDSELDAFIGIKPFDSWALNPDTCLWEAPVENPGGDHFWDEDSLSWVRGEQPFPSWIWNDQTNFWEPPTERPGDNFIWDEKSISWIEAPPIP